VTLLTPERPDVVLQACDAVVYGRVFPTKRATHSPLRDLATSGEQRGTWRIGMVHGALSIPGRTDGDDVVFTREEIAATGLDYLALGHWHSTQQAKAGAVTYGYAGAPEPMALDQDGAGRVLLVTLEEVGGKRSVAVEERQVGRTRFEKVELDAASIASQPAAVEQLAKRAHPDVVLDVQVVGVRPDELDLDPAEVENQLRGSFLKIRVRDQSLPALTGGTLPSPDTIAGAFIRDIEARIAQLEAADKAPEAAELRDVLRLGRLLLAGHEVTL
jgi:exonuclease SbcD